MSCPFCKYKKKFISDNRDFPRLIEDGNIIIPNIHRYWTFTVIECLKCKSYWLFKGEPKRDNILARGFYYFIDKESFNKINEMSFNEFIDFCISEFRGFKVGSFIEEKIDKYLKENYENIISILNTKRYIPDFIIEYILNNYKK